jgi:hypothetical protein
MAVLKIGTIDDLALRDVLLRAEVEQFTGRVAWLDALRDAKGEDRNYFC